MWVWQYEAEDGTHDMFMDIEEEVRFRVVEEVFVDTLPTNSKGKDYSLLFFPFFLPPLLSLFFCPSTHPPTTCPTLTPVQPHSVEGASGASPAAMLAGNTESGPQQAPYTIIVSRLALSSYL